jgi:hypothetical protein
MIIMMIFLIYRYLTSQEQFLLNFCRKHQTIIHIYPFFYQEFFEILDFCRQFPALSIFLLPNVSTLFSYFPLLSNRFSSSNQFSGQVRSGNFFLYIFGQAKLFYQNLIRILCCSTFTVGTCDLFRIIFSSFSKKTNPI